MLFDDEDTNFDVVGVTIFNESGSDSLRPNYYSDHRKKFEDIGGKAAFVTMKNGRNGQYYTFIPDSYLNYGYTENGRQWLPTKLFEGDNLSKLLSNSRYVEPYQIISNKAANYGIQGGGFFVPSSNISNDVSAALKPSFYFDVATHGNVQGLSKTSDGRFVYKTDQPNGYIDPVSNTSHWYEPPKKNNFAAIAGVALSIFAPGLGTAIGAAIGASGVAASILGNAILQGTLAEANGGDFFDGAVKGAISGGVAPAVAGSVGSTVANAMADSAVKNVVASAISSSVSSAIVAGVTGQDVGAAALNGAVMGAAGAAGQDIGTAAQYGTTPFSEQTQALMAQDRGMGFSGSTVGQNIGSAVGSIALGTPEDQALLSALTKTVSQGLSSLPSFSGTSKTDIKVADSGEEETQVAEGFDEEKIKSIIFNSASQLASNGDPSVDLAEIERLRGEGNFADTDTSTSVGAGDVAADQTDGEPSALDVLGQPISPEAVNVEPVITGATEPLVTEPMMPDPLVPSADNPNLEPGKTPQERAEEEWRRYMDSLSVKPEQLDIAPQDINEGQYWDEYNKNLKEIMDRGGFTSQWQQAGTDRVFVNDDGTGIGINENGDSYALTADEVKSMIDNGILNTLESGYVAATGGDQAEPNKLNTTNVTTTTVGAPNVVNPAARNLNSILSMGSAATQAPIREVDSSMDATRSSPAPFGQEGKFQGPLDDFFKIATQASYVPTPNKSPTPQQPQQAATMTDRLDQPQTGSGYFNYGQQTDIESNLFPQMGQPAPMISGGLPFKQGGMATPLMAGGGTTRYGRYAGGGLNVINHSGKHRFDFRQGDAVTGAGDGQSDDIPAMLADGEFVFPADVVAALGNGSTKAGSDKLYDMMHSIRAYHRSAKPEDLPPPAKKSPLDYLKKSKKAKKARS